MRQSEALLKLTSRQEPVSHDLRLPEPQLAQRIRDARQMCQSYARDHALPNWAKKLHDKYPMSSFYLDDDRRPCRVYGVVRDDDERVSRLHVAVAGKPIQAKVLRPHELQQVDRWPADLLKNLRKGKYDDPGYFTDPMGFIPVLETYVHTLRI